MHAHQRAPNGGFPGEFWRQTKLVILNQSEEVKLRVAYENNPFLF
jgi:hypothetical protein